MDKSTFYEKIVKKCKILSPEKEKELFLEMKNCTNKEKKLKIRNMIVESNLRFVPFLANRFRNKSISMEDAISLGNEGLLEAFKKFDISKGFTFRTYAAYHIKRRVRQEMLLEQKISITALNWIILDKIRKSRNEFYMEHGRKMTIDDILKIEGFEKYSKKYITNILVVYDKQMISTSDPVNSDQDIKSTYEDILADKHNFVDEIEVGVINEVINKWLDKNCNEKEKTIIEFRYGLNGKEKLSLEAVGKIYGVTRERIRQIQAEIEKRMKNDKFIKELAFNI
jgi:RNA polymerase nonessential primary-like sigma factor